MSPNLKSAALFQLSSAALFWSPVAGSVVALVGIVTHLVFIRRERGELLAVFVFAVGGGLSETLLMHLGLVRFATPGTIALLCPLWVIVFWAALGTLVTTTGSGHGCGDSWPLCRGQFIPEFAISTAIGSLSTPYRQRSATRRRANASRSSVSWRRSMSVRFRASVE